VSPERVALFVPCYVDQFFPHVARATLELLERRGLAVDFPLQQTCCGQPMANAGFERDAVGAARHFVETFAEYEHIVAPSGSCVYFVRHHFDMLDQTDAVQHVRERTHELSQFLVDVLGVEDPGVSFPYRVGLHQGCHGLRGLRLGTSSELAAAGRQASNGGAAAEPAAEGALAAGPTRFLLERVDGLELVELDRTDECCGFGGMFSVTEEAVSVRMGSDRVQDHIRNDAAVITSADMSCLMHLDGIIRRQSLPIRVMHLAEILNGEPVQA
jgi:L-lactate dehydrogenase complex protein LldE